MSLFDHMNLVKAIALRDRQPYLLLRKFWLEHLEGISSL